MFVSTLAKYAQLELGASVLWALCGFWGPAQRKSYVTSAEPYEEVPEAIAKGSRLVALSSWPPCRLGGGTVDGNH
jgi:hypothetical protein